MTHPITVDPAHSALAVIDMQNAFLDEQVGFRFAPAALEIVEPINELARRFRAAGGVVVWVQTTSRPDRADWFSLRRLLGDEAMDFRTSVLAEGAHGQALWPELDVADSDSITLKYRYSAMVEPDGQLEVLLRERGVTSLYVAGTQTNICCESTARDAMMLGYEAFMVADCLAAETPQLHDASLTSFASAFGRVLHSHQIDPVPTGGGQAITSVGLSG